MICNCIKELNDKLEKENLVFNGYALKMGSFKFCIAMKLEWMDKNKAPKGQKGRAPSLWATFCPFCGRPTEEKESI